MPSRKKAQGKARKEKRAAKTLTFEFGSQACTHREEKDWSWEDIDTALKLAEKVLTKLGIVSEQLILEVCNKYCQFNDDRKKLFKEIMVTSGTAACIEAAKETDLSKVSTVRGTSFHIGMILMIEVRDKYDGAYDQRIRNELEMCMNDIIPCPRETVKFFHRRSPCDCLKELYYQLKETTKRTSLCDHCVKIVGIREMSQCQHCKVAQYCSYDCAVAHWQVHKKECKKTRHCQDTKKAE